jgi:hypothetical protein
VKSIKRSFPRNWGVVNVYQRPSSNRLLVTRSEACPRHPNAQRTGACNSPATVELPGICDQFRHESPHSLSRLDPRCPRLLRSAMGGSVIRVLPSGQLCKPLADTGKAFSSLVLRMTCGDDPDDVPIARCSGPRSRLFSKSAPWIQPGHGLKHRHSVQPWRGARRACFRVFFADGCAVVRA